MKGLSENTLGSVVPIMSVAFGASVIEKHFILNKEIGGHDVSFSMDEKAFENMVIEVRKAESCIGKISCELTEKQKVGMKYSRSLLVCKDIKKGEIITINNVKSVRPGNGIHSKHYFEILDKKSMYDLKKGEPLKVLHIN